jgi:hypothetical protein
MVSSPVKIYLLASQWRFAICPLLPVIVAWVGGATKISDRLGNEQNAAPADSDGRTLA